MWCQLPYNLFRYQPGSGYNGYSDTREVDDPHAHSPTRHGTRPNGNGSSQPGSQPTSTVWPYRLFPPPMAQYPNVVGDLRFAPHRIPGPDPFIEPVRLVQGFTHPAKSSSDDVSMRDASTRGYPASSGSTSSRVPSSMTGLSYEHSQPASIPGTHEDDHYHEFVELMSPSKMLPAGSFAPAHVPSIPPTVSRPSAAAQARSESYSKTRQRATSLKDVSHPGTRNVSGSSARSEQGSEGIVETITTRRYHVSPKGNVKGKKEARAASANVRASKESESELTSENSSRDVSKAIKVQPRVTLQTSKSIIHVSGESKRKRHCGKALDESSQTSRDDMASPTKKISKLDSPDVTQQEGNDDSVNTATHAAVEQVTEVE
jgi:hypothetical protein